jgi:Acetyltransferase (GNAT) domain
MNIKILNADNGLWIETLDKLCHDVYHLPQYVVLDAKRTETTPEAFLLQNEDKIFFVPYLVRSCQDIVSSKSNNLEIFDLISPYGYPGILLSEAARHSPDFANLALVEFCQTLQERGICSAFLRLHPILSENFTKIFSPNTFVNNGETVSIDLTLDETIIWAKIRKGHQSTINKCKRLGLTARRVDFASYFNEFLAIYKETMERVKAKDIYYFSRDYFTDLLQLGDKLHLGIVESEAQIVCASLFFESCGIVQAHLGGTKTDFLKQSPFNLLLHFMGLWAKERGNQYLHIGGGVGGEKDKLFTFKSGFSKQRHQFLTTRLVVDEAKYYDLTSLRAKTLDKSPEDLLESKFFPAYRAS